MILADALQRLLDALAEVRFPIALPGSDDHARNAETIRGQLRDYLLPRADRLDAPLLAVVGGSTGSGKSTIVNSLLRRQVTRPGVLRPTTKSPVLICHPDDAPWFRSAKILPELVRTERALVESRALHIVELSAIPVGLALLDAPDIDSVDERNRALARQLFLAADLWLFLTSAARYADAIAWTLLKAAAARQIFLGIVVNRCPPRSIQEVAPDLARMLAEEGLGHVPLFAIEEQPLVEGLVADDSVAPIRGWLGRLASESEARAAVVKQSLGGALRQLDDGVASLHRGLVEQREAAKDLRAQATGEFSAAFARVNTSIGDGSILRSEIIAHWHDVVGTTQLMRGVDEKIASLRALAARWISAEPKAEQMQEEVSSQLATVIVEAGEAAVDGVGQVWTRTTWGRALLDDDLRELSPEFRERAVAAVRSWQQDVLGLVSEQGRGKRLRARLLAFGTNASGVTLMIVVFASTGGVTGAEAGIAGGTSLVAQRLLESVFGAGAVERLTHEARELLARRVQELFDGETRRFTSRLDEVTVPEEVAAAVSAASAEVREAREQL